MKRSPAGSVVEALHAPDAWFNDTLHPIRDRAQLADHMAAMASADDEFARCEWGGMCAGA